VGGLAPAQIFHQDVEFIGLRPDLGPGLHRYLVSHTEDVVNPRLLVSQLRIDGVAVFPDLILAHLFFPCDILTLALIILVVSGLHKQFASSYLIFTILKFSSPLRKTWGIGFLD